MKRLLLSATLSLLASTTTNAAIVVPGANGTDGALNITQDTVIDLSKATTGTWDQDNSANSGNGVYDPAKWAVVFKYTSVNVLAGKKLTFKNHATRAPVVWLVSGNVAISGTVDLSGESASAVGVAFHPVTSPVGGRLAEPGPGGFRGGASWRGGDVMQGAGFGMGGGQLGKGYRPNDIRMGGPGNYGPLQPRPYGNPSLLPLIGGSGGAGAIWGDSGYGGGAGGGAILVAVEGKLDFTLGGQFLARGGTYDDYDRSTGAGSGGAVRLICGEISGVGSLNASGGQGIPNGGDGRIRLERVANKANLTITPAPSSVDLLDGSTAIIWPPTNSPEARILAVNEKPTPLDPKAAFGAYTPDVALPLSSSIQVVVETLNVERESAVHIRITPRNGMTINGAQSKDLDEVTAKIKQVISENPLKIQWEATVPTLPGHSAIQARVVRP